MSKINKLVENFIGKADMKMRWEDFSTNIRR
jgi:hypothetical protein